MVKPHRHCMGHGLGFAFLTPLCSLQRLRQGELLPAQLSPGEHSPAHTKGCTAPGKIPVAGKEHKRLISFHFSPSHCPAVPSSPVHPAFCWWAAHAVPEQRGCRSTDPPQQMLQPEQTVASG